MSETGVIVFEPLIGKIIDAFFLSEDRLILFERIGSCLSSVHIFYHDKDCCECVYIEDTEGDLREILNAPIRMAEMVSKDGGSDKYGDRTWTFIKLGTEKESVTLRWLGESGGLGRGNYSRKIDYMSLELPRGDNGFPIKSAAPRVWGTKTPWGYGCYEEILEDSKGLFFECLEGLLFFECEYHMFEEIKHLCRQK